ncbi:hypothetical protein STPH2_1935 [Streptomyces sp. KO7888]|nr:hypothetical protein [Streptomyces sp. KO7888]
MWARHSLATPARGTGLRLGAECRPPRPTATSCVAVGSCPSVSTAATGSTWAACDIGNGVTNGMALLILAPLTWIAAAVPWVILHSTLGRRHRRTARTAGLIFTLWPTWFLATRLGMPDSYPAPLLHPGMTPAKPVNLVSRAAPCSTAPTIR